MASKRKSSGGGKTAASRYKAKPGFERIPGPERYYRDLVTGERITKRQYTKRSEHVSSNEAKAKRKKLERAVAGQPQPMTRYNAVVKQFKKTHGPKAKVRGNSPEARLFEENYRILVKHGPGSEHGNNMTKHRRRHLRALQNLGIITNADYERYTSDE